MTWPIVVCSLYTLTPHPSPLTPHISPITPHPSPLTPLTPPPSTRGDEPRRALSGTRVNGHAASRLSSPSPPPSFARPPPHPHTASLPAISCSWAPRAEELSLRLRTQARAGEGWGWCMSMRGGRRCKGLLPRCCLCKSSRVCTVLSRRVAATSSVPRLRLRPLLYIRPNATRASLPVRREEGYWLSATPGHEDLGPRVSGFGFQVSGSGFRDLRIYVHPKAGFRAQGTGFVVQGSEIRV
jgi:hypothetical protein